MNKIALITGATAGIGEATARRFYSGGYDVIITGRRSDRLQQLSDELTAQGANQVYTLNFDIRSSGAVESALLSLPEAWRNIDVLVNNAGLSRGLGPVDEGLLSDWEEMIDANVKGLLYVTRIVSGWMKARQAGHIINVGSTAAKEVYPGGNVYCATKHAVDALTRAMRIDFVHLRLKVSAVHPGYVDTEFSTVRFHGDTERAKKVYEGFRPLSGADVAEVIYWMAIAPEHVNIADVVLLPAAQGGVGVVRRD